MPDEPDSDRSDDRWGRATSVKFDDTAEDADKGGGKLPGEADRVSSNIVSAPCDSAPACLVTRALRVEEQLSLTVA